MILRNRLCKVLTEKEKYEDWISHDVRISRGGDDLEK